MIGVIQIELFIEDGEGFRVDRRGRALCDGVGTETAILRRVFLRIGEEGVKNPSRGSVIANNYFKNRNRKKTRFVWNRSGQPLKMIGNRFTGKGAKLVGGGVVVN